MVGYPTGFQRSGRKIGQISGQVLIRCNPNCQSFSTNRSSILSSKQIWSRPICVILSNNSGARSRNILPSSFLTCNDQLIQFRDMYGLVEYNMYHLSIITQHYNQRVCSPILYTYGYITFFLCMNRKNIFYKRFISIRKTVQSQFDQILT